MPLLITRHGVMADSPLTPREWEILKLLSEGFRQKQIAQRLFIQMETARKHIKNAYKKLGAHNKVEALQKAGIW